MRWIRNGVYLAALLVGLPWLVYRAVWLKKQRRGWWARLTGRIARRDPSRPCLLCHAVSVGEVNLLVPLLAELTRRDPHTEIVIAVTTTAGEKLARQRFPEYRIVPLPWDFSWAVHAWLKRLAPTQLWLAELEIWPNLIGACHRMGIPVKVANGRLGEKSFRGYQRGRWWMGAAFRELEEVAAQTPEIAERFRELGCSRVQVTGNLKFDGVAGDRQDARVQALARLSGWNLPAGPVWVAGSTQPEEDDLAVEVYRQLIANWPDLKLVLVPRHLQNVPRLVRQLKELAVPFTLRSELDGTRSADNVLVVDVIGELGHWWGLADVGYVGGSMGSREGQNMIEPAAYGAAISFGPRTKNFRAIVSELLAADAAVVVRDGGELKAFVEHCLTNPAAAQARGQRARQVITRHQGAAARTVDALWQRRVDHVATPPARVA